MADYTPDQIEQMRAEVIKADRLAAEEKAAQEAAFLLPLRQFTNSAAFQEVLATVPTIKAAYRDDTRFAAFIDNLVIGMPALAERAGPLPVVAVTPAPEGDTNGKG